MTTNISITLNGANLTEIRKQAVMFLTATEIAEVTTKPAKKAAAPVQETSEDNATEMTEDAGFDEVEETTPTKKPKAPKLTEKDVNAAAMAHAKSNGRPATLAILNKQFKVKSILELKPEQYQKVIEAFEG